MLDADFPHIPAAVREVALQYARANPPRGRSPAPADGPVKLWFDEDLSPTLVQVANERGLEATCHRDRPMLGATDSHLRALAQDAGGC